MSAAHTNEDADRVRLEAYEWRVRKSSGEMTSSEATAFEEWLNANPTHEDAFDRATTLWASYGALNRQNVDPALFETGFAGKLRLALHDLLSPKSTSVWRPAAVVSGFVAAVFALVFLVQPVPDAGVTEIEYAPVVANHRTSVGDIREVTLSDGSLVTLGPSTEINVSMSESMRRIDLLGGAAVFDVASDKERPFVVHADDFSARALGTVFDVRNNGGVVRLSVAEGKVEAGYPVSTKNILQGVNAKQRLQAGQRISSNEIDGLSKVGSFRQETFASWRDGRLRYVGAPLSEIIADANRYIDQPIKIDNGLNAIIKSKATFAFNVDDVEGMLEALPALFPVEVDRSEQGTVTIRAR
ncbi:MAG: FecR domain-containing protein [Pseudomonadota bacterium]